ncbi:leukotoxin LktA family filamentous adhesin, partial [Antarcticimicrobium luteum]
MASAAVLSAVLTVAPALQAAAQGIRPDGRTATTVTTKGRVTDVRTSTLSQGFGVNSLLDLNVGVGTVANIHAPKGAGGTVNIITGGRGVVVDGTLNGMKNGRVGGGLYIASPDGFTIGADGKILAGRIGLSTPTRGFARRMIGADGGVDGDAVRTLVDGNARLGEASIDVAGRIAADESVRLRAGGDITVSGRIEAGDRAGLMDAAVNMGDVSLFAGGAVRLQDGAGISAGGGEDGGRVDIRAGRDISLDWGAVVGAEGLKNGDGGEVVIFAGDTAHLGEGAVVSAAALGEGGGGFVEFSGVETVELMGELRAWSAMGEGGSVLIDPAEVIVSADVFTHGADYTLTASERIAVGEGVTVSTRNTGGTTDHLTADSIGASGALTLEAPVIEIEAGAMLLAFANAGGFASGDILLDAHVLDNIDLSTSALPAGTARITVLDAVLWGGDVTLRTRVNKDNIYSTDGMVNDYVTDMFGGTGVTQIDALLRNTVNGVDQDVAELLDTLDEANLPAALTARAITRVAGSYIIAKGNATISSKATTDIGLNPDNQALAIAVAYSDTQAETLVEGSQVFTGGDLNLSALAIEKLDLGAGSDDADSASNMALALSLRRSSATALMVGSTYRLSEIEGLTKSFPFDATVMGDATVHAEVRKDIAISATSGGNDSGAGEAVILSYDDTLAQASVTTFLRTDDGDFTIDALTDYVAYDLSATVDEDGLGLPVAAPTDGTDTLAAALDATRATLSSVLGSTLDGAAMVVDVANTETLASFGAETPYLSVLNPWWPEREGSGGSFAAMVDAEDDASEGTALTISALTDLGESSVAATVGSENDEGFSAGGTAILSGLGIETTATADGLNILSGPELAVEAELTGGYAMRQSSVGGADMGLSFGYLNTDFTTQAIMTDFFSSDIAGIAVSATEELELTNAQEAVTFSDAASGTLGFARTDYDSDVLARIGNNQFISDKRDAVSVAADSATSLDTVAMRNGTVLDDKAQVSAATALVTSHGEVRAEVLGWYGLERDALTISATDRTWRQIVANASADGDSLNVLGALAYDEYRRDTVARMSDVPIHGMVDGLSITALSETGSNVVSIGRATGDAGTSLAGLGAWIVDDRDVRARLAASYSEISLEGGLEIDATRTDNYVLLQGTEASSGSGAGIAVGVLLLGGETRTAAKLNLYTPVMSGGEPVDPEDPEFAPVWATVGDGGSVSITATNAATAFDLTMGGGAADNFGGMGSLAYVDMGHLADDTALTEATEVLLDGGSERADYSGETDTVLDAMAADYIAAGDLGGGGLAPQDVRDSLTIATLKVSDGVADLGSSVTVEAVDDRKATAIAGQLQSGLVAAATEAFTTYFSIDDLSEDGVDLSLRPDSVGDAVDTAKQVYGTGVKASYAISDFKDAISDAGTISTSATTVGAAAGVTVIGGSVVAEVDLTAADEWSADGSLSTGALTIASRNRATATALGFGMQLGSNSIGASVSHSRLNQMATAGILNGAVGAGTVDITAENSGRATTIGGIALGASGNAAVGGTVSLADLDAASLAAVTNATVTAGGGLTIDANDSSSALSLAIAGGGSAGSVSGIGAIGATSQRAVVRAGAFGSTLMATGGKLSIAATQDATTNALTVQGGGSGSIAVGAAISDVTLRGKTEALAISSALAANTSDIELSASSERSIGSAAMGANVGGTAGITGSISLITREDTVRAGVDGSALTAGDSILVESLAEATLGASGGGGEGLLSGIGAPTVSLAGGGTVGIGASITVITSSATVMAEVVGGSTLTATGTAEDNGIAGHRRDGQVLESHRYHGVAVVADSATALNALSVGAAAAGTVAISVQVPVLFVEDSVTAHIAGGSVDSAADISVMAGNASVLRILSMLAQGSGAVSGGADVEVLNLAKTTSALVEDADLIAVGDIGLDATSAEEIETTSASLSAGATAAVAGVVQVMKGENETTAVLSGGTAEAGGGLDIDAGSVRSIDQTGVNGNFGLYAAVGGQVFYMQAEDAVTAEIADGSAADHAVVDAEGDVAITAASDLEIDNIVVSGGAGAVAVSASVLVVKTEQEVSARIGEHASLTGRTADSILVEADQDIQHSATVGNINGGGAAIGAAVLQLSGGNQVLAEIDDHATATASGAVTVTAKAERDITADSAAAAVGGFAFQGSATLVSYGLDVLDLAANDGQPRSDSEIDSSLETVEDEMNDSGSFDGYGAGDDAAEAALERALSVRSAIASARGTVVPEGVTARVGESAVVRAGSVTVAGEESGIITATSGGVSGGTVSFTGALARVKLGSAVGVEIDTSAVLRSEGAISLTAGSDVDVGGTKAIAGTGGAIGGAAAVAETHAARIVGVTLADDVLLSGIGSGVAQDVEIAASETGDAAAEATGFSVGAIAAGGVFATTRSSSDIAVSFAGDATAPLLKADTLSIAATRAGAIEAKGLGLSGGSLFGLSGVDVAAYDSSEVGIDLGAVTLIAGGLVEISATSQAVMTVKGTGAAISQGISVSGTFAHAEREAQVEILADGFDLTAGELSVLALDAESTEADGASSISSKTFSASGGVGSAGGGVTSLENDASVSVDLTLAAMDVGGDAAVVSGTNTEIIALSTGLNLGFLGLGANLVEVNTDADAALSLAVSGTGVIGGALTALAAGIEDISVETHAGLGSIFSVHGAKSELDIDGDVTLDLDGGDGLSVGGTLAAATYRGVSFANTADSIEVSLADFGGTKIDNDVNADSSLILAGALDADAFEAEIVTEINKSDDGYSGQIGSGGLLDGTSLDSETDIDVTAVLTVADGARLTETGSDGVSDYDTHLAISSFYDLADSVKIDTGGGLLVPTAKTSIDVDASDVAIRIGDADIVADAGIEMEILAEATITTEAFVNVYGLAGSPHAEAISDYDAAQAIEISAGASVLSDEGSIHITSAGDASDISSELRVWNATAVPIGRKPYAKSRNALSNEITIDSGAEVRAANDVELVTGAGDTDTYSYGLASDLYRETAETVVNALGDIVGAEDVSLDTEVGETVETFSAAVLIDGEVESGTNYFQQLVVDESGVTAATDGLDYEILSDADLSDLLDLSLDDLNGELADAIATDDLVSQVRLEAEIARLETILDDMGTNPIDLIRVISAYSAPGDVEVTADTLTGGGTVISHGDATILIVNDSPAVIEVVEAEIPYRGGGLVLLNDIPLTDATAPSELTIQATASADIAAETLISVENFYASATGISGDIYVTGSIENLRGTVSLFTADGDIMVLGGEIDAANVDIHSGGDFVLTSGDGLVTLGASAFSTYAPLFANTLSGLDGCLDYICYLEDIAGSDYEDVLSGGGEIVAQGGVYVYANGEVNITGLIQSGVTDFEVMIEDSITDVIDDWDSLQTVAVLYSPAGNGTSPAEEPFQDAASGNVTLRYDQDSGVILIDPIIAKGGEIEIVGHIISTGGGELVAANGYAHVEITNESDLPIVLSDISTGYDEGANGFIRIVDLARENSSGDGFVTTEYELAADGTVTRTVTGLLVRPIVQIDKPTYEIVDDWRVVYAAGEIVPRVDGSYEYDEDNLGAIIVTRYDHVDIALDADFNGRIDEDEVTSSSVVEEEELANVPFSSKYAVLAEEIDIDTILDDLGSSFPDGVVNAWVGDSDYDYVQVGDQDLVTAWDFESVDVGDWTLEQDNPFGADVYERTRTVTETTSNWDVHIIAADRTVGIGFEGHDMGSLTVTSVGDVIFDGSVYNRSGLTTITSTGGAILANSRSNPFETNKLVMSAEGDILYSRAYDGPGYTGGGDAGIEMVLPGARDHDFLGSSGTVLGSLFSSTTAATDFRIDQAEGFGLDISAGGSARIEEVTGDMEILSAYAEDDLHLTAANSILVHRYSTAPVQVAGERLKLTTTAGSVGTLEAPLVFEADAIVADAGGDINLLTSSDQPVRVKHLISAEGDVSLVSTVSDIWDYDFTATVDRRAEEGLLEALWDEMGLRAVDADGAAETERETELIASFEEQKTQDYFEYWNRLRTWEVDGSGALVEGEPLAYDPDFAVTFSAEEIVRLEADGLSAAQIADLAETATERFHALHETWGSVRFDADFEYNATLANRSELTTGLHWSEAQLGTGLRSELILPVTDTVPVIEDPNFLGHDINIVSAGDIGRNRNPYVIDRATGLTEEALLELWTAERVDIGIGEDSIEVARADDVDIEATGHLFALAGGDALIGSEHAIEILYADAVEDLRIKSAEALTRAPDGDLVPHMLRGKTIVLEAAEGGIGALSEPLLITQLADGALVARADGQIRLTAPTSDMAVTEIFSDTGVVLSTLTGSILDQGGTDGVDILTDNLVLLSAGSIGTEDDPLDVQMYGGDGSISAVALTGDLDLAVTDGDVSVGLIGSYLGDVRIDIQAGDLRLLGLSDPALAELFTVEALAGGTGATETGIGGLQGAFSGPGSPLDELADLPKTGAETLAPEIDLPWASGGIDGDSSSDIPMIAAIHAGGTLVLDVSGSVVGREGGALDIQASEKAEFRTGDSFGTRENYILSRLDAAPDGAPAELYLRDYDKDDGRAPDYYLANIGATDLRKANLTEGESTVRLMSYGDLTVDAASLLRGGTIWLGAVGDNPNGSGADVVVGNGVTVEADGLGLFSTNAVEIEGTDGLSVEGADLMVLASNLLFPDACSGCGSVTVAGDHVLNIVTEHSVNLASVAVPEGDVRILTAGVGKIGIGTLEADQISLITRFGDVDIATLTGADLTVIANGTVHPGVYALSGSVDIDATMIGRSAAEPLTLIGGEEATEIALYGEYGMYVELDDGDLYEIETLGAGATGVGINLDALSDGLATLTLKSVATAGSDVTVTSDILTIAGDVTSTGGDVTMRSLVGALRMADNTLIDALNGHITLTSAGDMVLASLRTLGQDPDAPMIYVSATEALTLADTIGANIMAGVPGDAHAVVYAGAIATGPGESLWIDASQITVYSGLGDLHLTSTLAETGIVSLVSGNGDDIDFVALGDIVLKDAELISADPLGIEKGRISLNSNYGDIDGSVATLEAAELTMVTPEGRIGAPGSPVALVSDGSTRLRVGATGVIALDVAGDLDAAFILSEGGSVAVTATGTAQIDLIGGSGSVTVESAGGSVTLVTEGTVVPTIPEIANLTTATRFPELVAGPQPELVLADGDDGTGDDGTGDDGTGDDGTGDDGTGDDGTGDDGTGDDGTGDDGTGDDGTGDDGTGDDGTGDDGTGDDGTGDDGTGDDGTGDDG